MENVNVYSESFKREVCALYLTGNYSKKELSRRFGIPGKSTLSRWLLKFDHGQKGLPKILAKTTPQKSVEPSTSELALLKAKLTEAELKIEAYERLIVNAQRQFKIDIIKKADTK